MRSEATATLPAQGDRLASAVAVVGHLRSAEPETTTIEDASRRLGIGRSLGYSLARDGKFPCRIIRAGRRLLVPTAALDSILGAESNEALAS